MAILEGLGPKGTVFEDLQPGDYLFEISDPGEKGWFFEVVDKDSDGNETDAKATYVNWRFRVLQPEEFENKPFFHLTMVSATPEKIAKAKRPYDPSGFTYQFFGDSGIALKHGGEVTLLDDYLTDGCPDLDKMIGVQFWGSVRMRKVKTQNGEEERASLQKVWKA